MTYKDELKRAMEHLAQDPKTVFIGYNVGCGGKANGTLVDVPQAQLIETPVAENLMVGMAIGMALDGWKPVVYIERCDFILNALDAIVNHLGKTKLLSGSEFDPHIIIRVVVGGKTKPLFTGPTHTQDFCEALRALVTFPVIRLGHVSGVFGSYRRNFQFLDVHSTLLLEYRDLYDQQV
jgi:pyruvate/2-oxoglutarate/acetoin dehydrogenase E1 component